MIRKRCNFSYYIYWPQNCLSFSVKTRHNHFGDGGVFELDLGNSEILMTPKQKEAGSLKKKIKT